MSGGARQAGRSAQAWAGGRLQYAVCGTRHTGTVWPNCALCCTLHSQTVGGCCRVALARAALACFKPRLALTPLLCLLCCAAGSTPTTWMCRTAAPTTPLSKRGGGGGGEVVCSLWPGHGGRAASWQPVSWRQPRLAASKQHGANDPSSTRPPPARLPSVPPPTSLPLPRPPPTCAALLRT